MVLFHLYNSDSLSSMADCDSCKLKPCGNLKDLFSFFFFSLLKKRETHVCLLSLQSAFFSADLLASGVENSEMVGLSA